MIFAGDDEHAWRAARNAKFAASSAVLFVGVYGGDAIFHGVDGSDTTIPSGVLVALFAAIGTGSVAKRVFGRRSD